MRSNPNLKDLIDVAAGRKEPDLVISGKVFSVFTGECFEADVAIHNGQIAGIGDYQGKTVEVEYILPGFIDAHIHIESSHLHPAEFARAVLKHGTTAVVSDPHEIANVCGKDGVKFMIEATSKLPVDFYFTIPSCVPAVFNLETYGGVIDSKDVEEMLKWERVVGLAEVMNYPGVVEGNEEVLSKIYAAKTLGKVIDGHSPGLTSILLNAYISAGITTDHECTSAKEAMEKLRRGMKIMLREGSAAKNLRELAKIVSDYSSCYTMIVCDDITPEDLCRGHIDERLRLAVKYGIKAEDAIRMVTVNPAMHYSLKCGVISPGYKADLVVVNGFDDFKVDLVVKDGKVVWDKNGYNTSFPKLVRKVSKFNMVEVTLDDVKIPVEGKVCRLIKPVRDQILTEIGEYEPIVKDGLALPDPEQGIAKVVVVDRHNGERAIGKGFVEFKIREGAIASSYSHDSHNCICVGVSDGDIVRAMNAVREMGGGIAVSNGDVVAKLPLSIAGLMSELDFEEVVKRMEKIKEELHSIGADASENPLVEMSFLALPVIPEIRITDFGLVDVRELKVVDLWIE